MKSLHTVRKEGKRRRGIEKMGKLPFTCPVCGRKKDYSLEELKEGAVLTCPFCRLTLTLHGHMWEDVQREIKKEEARGHEKVPGKEP